MKTRIAPVEIKAVGVAGEGRFQAYASIFNNVDSYGDMVVPGAFSDSLAKDFGPSGKGVPLYWRHRMDDPFMNLGSTVSAVEDDKGLLIDGLLDLETPAAAQTYKLLKEQRVRQMSFAYDIDEAGWIDRKAEDGGGYYELRKLTLHEVSVVPVGANQETEILAVKAAVLSLADTSVGRDLSPADRAELLDAAKTFSELLAKVQQPVTGVPDAKAEEPSGAKAEEPTTVPGFGELAETIMNRTRGWV